jgi:hypothetical protein
MGLRRLALASLALVAASLVAAGPAGAKDGVKATLASRVPLDAPAGTQLRVAWRLFALDENGQRRPFGASGVFVRLGSASGAETREGFAPVRNHSTGGYEAVVVVPKGGIGDIEIGLLGWRSDATGTHRGDAIFPITNDPLPGAPRVASPPAPNILPPEASPPVSAPAESSAPAPQRPESRSTWVFVGIGAVLLGLAVVLVAVPLSRKRRRGVVTAARLQLPQ